MPQPTRSDAVELLSPPDAETASRQVILGLVGTIRQCSRSACPQPAVATLTYVYSDSTAVLGPLATFAEPHCYDLCAQHADRLTVPRGWEVVRLDLSDTRSAPDPDDLLALANAVREAAADADQRPAPLAQREPRSALKPPAGTTSGTPAAIPPGGATGTPGRRGHLRILRD